MSEIRCRIRFVVAGGERPVGTLRVRVADVGRADASAIVVAETTIEQVQVSATVEPPVVILDVPSPEAPQQLAVEAHLDIDGSGETSVGDFRTMEHFGVTPADLDSAEPIEVRLRPVT